MTERFKLLVEEIKRNVGETVSLLLDDINVESSLTVVRCDGGRMNISIDPSFYSNSHIRRHLFDEIIPTTLHAVHAKELIYVCTAWTAFLEDGLPNNVREDELLARNHPERKESVCVYAFDADDRYVEVAHIKRNLGKTAELGPWRRYDGPSMTGLAANLWDALR
jgi:hypothetical protein